MWLVLEYGQIQTGAVETSVTAGRGIHLSHLSHLPKWEYTGVTWNRMIQGSFKWGEVRTVKEDGTPERG